MREQLEAAGMHTRQHRDRHAGIEATNGPWREHQTKVDLAALERLRKRRTVLYEDIADVGEAFRAQQVLGDVKGRDAERVLGDPLTISGGASSTRIRIVVVSGGPSSASDPRAPRTPAAAANDGLARKSRRFC